MQVTTTEPKLAAAFTEWLRRYQEEPERFKAESELLTANATTYGERCAPYLIKILEDQKTPPQPKAGKASG